MKTLTVDSRRVTLLEDETEYEIHVENSKKKIEVTATPQDLNAKFVTGYGERVGNNAITLNGEKTNFEIKVMAENGKIRTYKITIIKTDYKSNDNKLKSLKINEINFNFKSNIYEYNLEVENEIEKVTLEAVPNYDRATVEYEPSYQLTEGINNIVVKVKAEDGTEQEYKINITRKSLGVLVSNIRIDDIVFDFNPNKYEYEILTSKDTLNFHVTLNKKTATSKILNNTNLKNGSVVRILVQDNDKEIYYNFKISNKDISTTSSNNSNILTTDIAGGGSKFFQKYEMLIGFASLGIGTLGLLIAILTRPKKDKEEDEIIK